jgi:small GTP-binding protein
VNFKKFIALICTFSFVFSNLINVSAAPGDKVKKVKAIFLGDPKAGKTTLVQGFMYGTFSRDYESTMGVDCFTRSVYNNTVTIQMWDIPGAEKHRNLSLSYCPEVDTAVICVDSTDQTSIDHIGTWVEFVNENCPKGVTIILVATKKVDNENVNGNAKRIEEEAKRCGAAFCSVNAATGYEMEKFINLLANATTETVAAEHGAAEVGTTAAAITPTKVETAETAATTKTGTPLLPSLLLAGIVAGITIVGGLAATLVRAWVKSRLPANRPQPQLAECSKKLLK